MRVKHPKHQPRTGFTLVELLVVIGILAVLVALSAAGIVRYVSVQGHRNTRSRLQALDKILQESWSKVIADSRSPSDPPSAAVMSLAGGNISRARVIWTKLRLMEAFPITLDEIRNPSPLISRRKYTATYQRNLGTANPSNPETESAICLRLALTAIRRGAATDDLEKYSFDTDADDVKELVDDWGQALAFYRFPTGNPKLAEAALVTTRVNDRFRDRLDPEGTLLSNSWNGRNNFERLVHPISPDGNRSYFITPAIVSAGPDGKFGLETKTMRVIPNTQFEFDNIYQFTLRIGSGAKTTK